jgi:hypothetical protein
MNPHFVVNIHLRPFGLARRAACEWRVLALVVPGDGVP